MKELIPATDAEMSHGRRIFTGWLAASLAVLLLAAYIWQPPLPPVILDDDYPLYDAVIRAEAAQRLSQGVPSIPAIDVFNRTDLFDSCPFDAASDPVSPASLKVHSLPLDPSRFPSGHNYHFTDGNDINLSHLTIALGNVVDNPDGSRGVLVRSNLGSSSGTSLYRANRSPEGNWQLIKHDLSLFIGCGKLIWQ